MRERPHAIEHEKKLLSAMMLKEGEAIPRVTAQITAEEFYRPEHRLIFKAIVETYNTVPTPIDSLFLMDTLNRLEPDVRISRAYVLSLLEYEYTTARVDTYIKNIKETARLRRLIDMTEIAMDEAFDGTKSAAEIQADLEKMLYRDDDKQPADLEQAKTIIKGVRDHTQKIMNSHELTGVPTGLADLDKVLNGLQNSDLIFLAARPSMGKTALALSIAVNAAKKQKSVALFSLEMSKSQIGTRILSLMSEVPVIKIATGNLSGNDIDALDYADEKLDDLPLYVDDTSTMSVGAIRAKAKKCQRDHGLDLIVIDYIQLMVGDRDNPNRVQEVSQISRSLKALAKYLNVPVLVLSQLNRQAEMRADKRPQLSDLRESGSLEQDADIVMFLYRDEYYYREESETPDVAELNIAKNRNGATGAVRLHFSKATTAFKDLTRIEY